ncbi:MAG: hypothetical protein ABSH38_18995 [Verrucomicrobiota bacterium]
MKTLIVPLCVWLVAGLFCAQAGAAVVPARSFSGQFVARELQAQTPAAAAPQGIRAPIAGGWAFLLVPKPLSSGTNGAEITLEPAVLVVSCERLKALFLSELGLSGQWQGRVDLIINPAMAEEKGPLLAAVHDRSGWNYELDLPKKLRAEILEQALIHTLLLEVVNRHAGNRSAEIPAWLVDGLSAHLQAYNLPTFLLQPGVQMAANNVRLEGSDLVRDQLRLHAPLSFQQLSWPKADDTTGDGLKLYRACAQLFLEGLLQFPDGKDCLRRMLELLPEHFNWQTSFLLAFHPHFDQLLDVEKWWGLTAVGFSKTDPAQPWDAAQSWNKLQAALDVPVAVHFDAGRMPVEARLTLQEVIAQWPARDATPALQRAMADLQLLQAKASPDFRLLAALYLKTLQDYLNQSQMAPRPLGKHPPPALHPLQVNTIRQLEQLDQQRAALRRQALPQASQLSAAQNPAPPPAAGH